MGTAPARLKWAVSCIPLKMNAKYQDETVLFILRDARGVNIFAIYGDKEEESRASLFSTRYSQGISLGAAV